MSLVDKIFKLFKKSENVDYKHYADCIIFDVFGNLLLLQRSTQNDFQGGKWGLPGGKIEEDELEDMAAARELEEETGLKVRLDYLDTIQKENCEISYYLGFLTDNIQLLILDNDEHYHYQFVPLDELDNYDLLLDLRETLKGFPLEGLITDNLAELPIADRIVKKVSNQQVKNLLNKGLISDDDYFNFIQINKAISDIKKGFDLGIVEDEKYLQAIQKSKEYELIKVIKDNKLFFQFDNIKEIKKSEGGNPSHGGKLIKVNKVDKNGNKTTKWIKHEDLKNEIGNDEIHIKEKSYSDKELKEHAKNASEAALKDTIANHTDPKIRKTAHEELDRRSKQEAVQEDGNEGGQKIEEKQQQKFGKILIKKLKDAGFKDVSESPNTSKTDYGVSTYVVCYDKNGKHRKFRFSDHNVENEVRKVSEYHLANTEKSVDRAIEKLKNDVKKDDEVKEEQEKETKKRKDLQDKYDAIFNDIKKELGDGISFFKNERTKATLEEFEKKNPKAKNIYQVDLGNGAFSYEYAAPDNGYGKEKPSNDWIKNYIDSK